MTSFRDERTLKKVRKTEFVTHLPAVSGWLPKETWLAETCLAERRQGRKVLVYLRQTGEHDLQPRLKEYLEAQGLRVGILRPSLAPRRRAGWIKRHAHSFDVLLTNPKLVQVGLNLTSFATGIFFELDLSLYTTWQAMRRLWRPGQQMPVRMLFPVYEDTLEERMLDLMGSKMLAAQVFYGDEVGGALVEEGAESDLLGDLVRAALGELNVGRTEGVFNLGSEMKVTHSPYGSPTLTSPHLAFIVADPDLRARFFRRKRNGRRAAPVADGQLSLFN